MSSPIPPTDLTQRPPRCMRQRLGAKVIVTGRNPETLASARKTLGDVVVLGFRRSGRRSGARRRRRSIELTAATLLREFVSEFTYLGSKVAAKLTPVA
jgi:hypothetical protein